MYKWIKVSIVLIVVSFVDWSNFDVEDIMINLRIKSRIKNIKRENEIVLFSRLIFFIRLLIRRFLIQQEYERSSFQIIWHVKSEENNEYEETSIDFIIRVKNVDHQNVTNTFLSVR
jgi:hypothetical protein